MTEQDNQYLNLIDHTNKDDNQIKIESDNLQKDDIKLDKEQDKSKDEIKDKGITITTNNNTNTTNEVRIEKRSSFLSGEALRRVSTHIRQTLIIRFRDILGEDNEFPFWLEVVLYIGGLMFMSLNVCMPVFIHLSYLYIDLIKYAYPYYDSVNYIFFGSLTVVGLVYYIFSLYETRMRWVIVNTMFILFIMLNINFAIYSVRSACYHYKTVDVDRFLMRMSFTQGLIVVVGYSLYMVYNNYTYADNLNWECTHLQKGLDESAYVAISGQSMQKNCQMLYMSVFWNPFIYGFMQLVISQLLYQFVQGECHEHDDAHNHDTMVHKIEYYMNCFKAIIIGYAVLIFFFYLVLSIASAYELYLTFLIDYLKDLLIYMTIMILLVVYEKVSMSVRMAELEEITYFKKLEDMLDNDIVRACVVLFLGIPLFFLYIVIFIKHCIFNSYDRKKDFFLNWLIKGSLSRILNYMVIINIFIVLLASFAINLFTACMVYFSNILSGLNIYLVITIYYFFGLTIFLVPMEPKLPIYIIGGLIIGPYFYRTYDTPGSYTFFCIGIIVATIEALIIKLSSQVLIQYLAKFLSSNKSVQLEVGVHKPLMKAVGDIFRHPEYLSVQMMCFCSLPDEPLSILTGLLGLEYLQCIKACSAVVVMIFFYVLTGACLGMVGNLFEKLSGAILVVTMILQTWFMYYSFNQINDYISKNKAYYDDKNNYTEFERELMKIEEEHEYLAKQRLLASNLGNFNVYDITLVVMSNIVFTFCTIVCMLFESKCFRTVGFNSNTLLPTSQGGLDGNILMVLKGYGYVVLCLFVTGLVLYILNQYKISIYVRLYSYEEIMEDNKHYIVWTRKKGTSLSCIDRLFCIPDVDSKKVEIVGVIPGLKPV